MSVVLTRRGDGGAGKQAPRFTRPARSSLECQSHEPTTPGCLGGVSAGVLVCAPWIGKWAPAASLDIRRSILKVSRSIFGGWQCACWSSVPRETPKAVLSAQRVDEGRRYTFPHGAYLAPPPMVVVVGRRRGGVRGGRRASPRWGPCSGSPCRCPRRQPSRGGQHEMPHPSAVAPPGERQ